jgi:hypothetical protein
VARTFKDQPPDGAYLNLNVTRGIWQKLMMSRADAVPAHRMDRGDLWPQRLQSVGFETDGFDELPRFSSMVC